MSDLVEVTMSQFFAYIGPRDIVSSAVSAPQADREAWAPIYSVFKTRGGTPVGRIRRTRTYPHTSTYELERGLINV